MTERSPVYIHAHLHRHQISYMHTSMKTLDKNICCILVP